MNQNLLQMLQPKTTFVFVFFSSYSNHPIILLESWNRCRQIQRQHSSPVVKNPWLLASTRPWPMNTLCGGVHHQHLAICQRKFATHFKKVRIPSKLEALTFVLRELIVFRWFGSAVLTWTESPWSAGVSCHCEASRLISGPCGEPYLPFIISLPFLFPSLTHDQFCLWSPVIYCDLNDNDCESSQASQRGSIWNHWWRKYRGCTLPYCCFNRWITEWRCSGTVQGVMEDFWLIVVIDFPSLAPSQFN